MSSQFRAERHSLSIELDGVRYGIAVQWYGPENVYYIDHIWDQTNRQSLPIQEIEKAYMRGRRTLAGTTVRSKWAARRRGKQYVKIWLELSAGDDIRHGKLGEKLLAEPPNPSTADTDVQQSSGN